LALFASEAFKEICGVVIDIGISRLDSALSNLRNSTIDKQLFNSIKDAFNELCETVGWERASKTITQTFLLEMAQRTTIDTSERLEEVLTISKGQPAKIEDIEHFEKTLRKQIATHLELVNFLIVSEIWNPNQIETKHATDSHNAIGHNTDMEHGVTRRVIGDENDTLATDSSSLFFFLSPKARHN
jgi:hypothetical protein